MRAERYFNLHHLSNEEKLEVAIISFEGDALLWFQCENRRRAIARWEELRVLLLWQFRLEQTGSLHEQWLALKQEGDVLGYRQKFIELSAPLENISEEIALGNYINGLKLDIRAEIRLLEPTNLGRAMDLAQKIEAKLQLTRTCRDIGGSRNFRPSFNTSSGHSGRTASRC